MKLFTSLEETILYTHPDKLDLLAMIYLKLPANQLLLEEYRERWAGVVEPRRVAQEGST